VNLGVLSGLVVNLYVYGSRFFDAEFADRVSNYELVKLVALLLILSQHIFLATNARIISKRLTNSFPALSTSANYGIGQHSEQRTALQVP
jgi:hypothetical protein